MELVLRRLRSLFWIKKSSRNATKRNMDKLSRITQSLTRLPLGKVSALIAGLLLLVVLYQAAQISWLLVVPEPSATTPWQPPKVSTSKSSGNARRDFSQFTLFGEAKDEVEPVEVVPQVTEAPETSLNVILTGVVASSNSERSSAIIESQGKQQTYGIGDKIRSTSAVLAEIHADRIILRHRGRLETLMLDGFDYDKPSANMTTNRQAKNKAVPRKSTPARRINKRDQASLRKQIANSREAILKDPGKITDYLRISPVRKQGQLVGYRLNPGKDRALFTQAGFKANDLAVSLNGYDLTDLGQSMEVMAELATMTDVSITVDRDGQLIEILFNLPGQ